jgi:DNA-binding response OmpR family regulator
MEMIHPGKIVLVIDDDEDFQTILKVTLNQSGFKVRSLFNGQLGHTLDEKPFPDIILLDIDLPHANGVEVSKELKSNAHTKDIPVIMVSANPYVDKLCKEAGANDYVQKPFTLKTLIQKVEERLTAASRMYPAL